ncbi:MAG TPA: hypothetical protein DCE65_02035 [Clostridiales bacterium]|nr:hypothetical protein [Clostridiales bacterium]
MFRRFFRKTKRIVREKNAFRDIPFPFVYYYTTKSCKTSRVLTKKYRFSPLFFCFPRKNTIGIGQKTKKSMRPLQGPCSDAYFPGA